MGCLVWVGAKDTGLLVSDWGQYDRGPCCEKWVLEEDATGGCKTAGVGAGNRSLVLRVGRHADGGGPQVGVGDGHSVCNHRACVLECARYYHWGQGG